MGAPQLTRQSADEDQTCETISALLARVGDKWSLLVVSSLGNGALRFNELRRRIGDISQKMLSSTLKALERDGMVSRTVSPTVPPQVEYRLTDLGQELLVPFWHSPSGLRAISLGSLRLGPLMTPVSRGTED